MDNRIVSIVNEKGGVGKTTTTSCIGSILASKGYKVLMIDLDPQSDLTLSCPVKPDPEINIFNCLFGLGKLKGLNVNPNLVIIPGSPQLQPLNFMDQVKLSPKFQFENPRLILKELLKPVLKMDDLIVLLDCPPNKDIIVQNALAASTDVLIPTFCHNFSYNGIIDILNLVKKFKEKLNPDLEILGVLVNNYDQRNNIDKGVMEMMHDSLNNLVFQNPVKTNSKLKETTHLGIEIIEYARQLSEMKIPRPFQGFEDYSLVTDEFLDRLKLPRTLNQVAS